MIPLNADVDAIPCRKCGYDLRGTALDAPCPECGEPAINTKVPYRVDGDCLVVRTRAKLPRRCALTDPDTLVEIEPGRVGTLRRWCRILWPSEYTLVVPSRRVRWSVWSVVLGLIALLVLVKFFDGGGDDYEMYVGITLSVCFVVLPVVGIAALAKLEPRCKVAIGISVGAELRRAAFGAMVIAGCFFVGLLVSLAYLYMRSPWADEHGIWGFGVLVGIVLTIICMSCFGRIFRAAKHIDGEFWITGCSRSYLDHCLAERARVFAEAGVTDPITNDAATRAPASSPAPLAEDSTRATSE